MPADGKRKLILNAVVTQIKAATGANYFFDYSSDVVALTRETVQTRIESTRDVSVQIQDGAEQTTRALRSASVVMDVAIIVTVKAQPASLVDALQNVFADISRVLGLLPDLGVECTSTRIDSIEKPFYDFSKRSAVATMHLRAEYDYEPGVDT